jgi:hypothetical protein
MIPTWPGVKMVPSSLVRGIGSENESTARTSDRYSASSLKARAMNHAPVISRGAFVVPCVCLQFVLNDLKVSGRFLG